MQELTMEEVVAVSGGSDVNWGTVGAAAFSGAVGGALAGARTGNPYAVVAYATFYGALGGAGSLLMQVYMH